MNRLFVLFVITNGGIILHSAVKTKRQVLQGCLPYLFYNRRDEKMCEIKKKHIPLHIKKGLHKNFMKKILFLLPIFVLGCFVMMVSCKKEEADACWEITTYRDNKTTETIYFYGSEEGAKNCSPSGNMLGVDYRVEIKKASSKDAFACSNNGNSGNSKAPSDTACWEVIVFVNDMQTMTSYFWGSRTDAQNSVPGANVLGSTIRVEVKETSASDEMSCSQANFTHDNDSGLPEPDATLPAL